MREYVPQSGSCVSVPPVIGLLSGDDSVAGTISDRLHSEGYVVSEAESVEDFCLNCSRGRYDAIILDHNSGVGTAGVDILRNLRKSYFIPIVYIVGVEGLNRETMDVTEYLDGIEFGLAVAKLNAKYVVNEDRLDFIAGIKIGESVGLHRANYVVAKERVNFMDSVCSNIRNIFINSSVDDFSLRKGNFWGESIIVEPLACGAYKEVYKAKIWRFSEYKYLKGNYFALKIFKRRDKLSGRRTITSMKSTGWNLEEKFREEIDLLRSLPRSTHVTRFEECGMLKFSGNVFFDQFYYFEEFVKGISLKQYEERFSGGILPLSDVYKIFSQVALGLWSLHKVNISHCDFHNKNLILEGVKSRISDERVVLIDLGNSRKIYSSTVPSYLGSFQHLAPEQVLTGTGSVQSDLWSLGVGLYESLVGVKPFYSSSPHWGELSMKDLLAQERELASSILYSDIVPPSVARARRVSDEKLRGKFTREKIPQCIDTLVMELLSRDSERPSALHVYNRLRRLR